MRSFIQFVAVFGVVAALSHPAQAYVDLGTGSMMVQLLVGAVTGILVAGKLYWQKIKCLVLRRSVDDTDADRASNER